MFKIKIIFEILINPRGFYFWAFLSFQFGLKDGKYFIKIFFDIIWAINVWLEVDELLYLDKSF